MAVGTSKFSLICAVASGSALLALAAAGLWWYRRRQQKLKQENSSPRPEDLTRVVATVDKLWVYPMKSAYRVAVDEIECTKRGFKHDRCWVVTNDQLRILSQKLAPKLATITPKVESTDDGRYSLLLSAPGRDELKIPQPDEETPFTSLSLFNIAGNGQDVGDEAAEWVSECIGLSGCRVFYMAASSEPRKPQDHPKFGDLCFPEDETSFSNFSPVFVLSSESLEELNTRITPPMPITRFRPNIVVTGCTKPHEEDSWKLVRIGECVFQLITPGPRCGVTTVDQELGERRNNEPLDTLNTYRRHQQVYGEYNERYSTGPLFGSNFSVLVPGKIKLGDSVYVA